MTRLLHLWRQLGRDHAAISDGERNDIVDGVAVVVSAMGILAVIALSIVAHGGVS